jgi:hypothetical protein
MGLDSARTATAVKKTIIYLCTSKRVFLGLLATAEGDKDGPKMFLGGLGLLVLTWLLITLAAREKKNRRLDNAL